MAFEVQKRIKGLLPVPDPDHNTSFRVYHCALERYNTINTAYYEFVEENPKSKPQFWAHKVFTLVPITQLRTRCVRLTSVGNGRSKSLEKEKKKKRKEKKRKEKEKERKRKEKEKEN